MDLSDEASLRFPIYEMIKSDLVFCEAREGKRLDKG